MGADIGILYIFFKRETDSQLTAVEEKIIPGRKRTLQLLAQGSSYWLRVWSSELFLQYLYCRFPLANSIGQFLLSTTCGHDENFQ